MRASLLRKSCFTVIVIFFPFEVIFSILKSHRKYNCDISIGLEVVGQLLSNDPSLHGTVKCERGESPPVKT